MSATIDKLLEEHREMEKLMSLLSREVQAFSDGKTMDFELVQSILEYSLSFPDSCHHPKEDVIFQQLCKRDAEAAKAIGDLAQEHEELHAYVVRFAVAVENILTDHELPRDWFSEVAEDYLRLMRRHMQMEEVVFFPAAERVLTDDDWTYVDLQVFGVDHPLFDEKVDKHYDSLRQAILSAEGGSNIAAQ